MGLGGVVVVVAVALGFHGGRAAEGTVDHDVVALGKLVIDGHREGSPDCRYPPWGVWALQTMDLR